MPKQSAKNRWLAAASLVFYSFGQPVYLLLLLASVTVNYLFGRRLMGGQRPKQTVTCAVVINLLVLGAFKYLDFFVTTINGIFGCALPLAGITLPIGISFYTFQGLSYVIDVYRRPDSGTRDMGKLLLYISFFPQLIAGPIVKYHDVAQQIDSRELTPRLTLTGLQRFIGGLAKKLILSNAVGQIADTVFSLTTTELDMRLAWLGAICYTLQIYFDFSGYSDMAIGLGRMFGFTFRENFDLPYTARTIKDFWRKWHISLSSWFRDYLYIPLGGSRTGKARTMRNKLIVFFATGLWHGANWTFVLWGLWHGLFATLEDFNVIPKRVGRSWLGHLYTMLVVVLGFVLFRADNVTAAGRMLSAMFTGFAWTAAHTLTLYQILSPYAVCILLIAILFAAGLPQKWIHNLGCRVSKSVQSAACGTAYSLLFFLCILTLSGTTFNPFIYFQF